MKRHLICVFLLAVVFQVHAALEFYDSFNYSPTDRQLSTVAGGAWVNYAGGGIGPTNTSGSLSYPGLLTASGDNSVLFNGTGASGIAARKLSALYSWTTVGPTGLFYSLTFKVTSISAADWGGSGNFLTGSYMMGFNQKQTNGTALAATDVAAPLLIRTGDPNNVSGTANDFQGYQLGTGVTATSPSSRIFDSTHVYLPGDTLFLVLSYTFGPGGSDDVAKLYVNPIPGSIESANTAAVIASGLTDVANGQIQSFFLRNNSVEPAGTQIDDLRIGTSWQDVTPAPEPSAAALLSLATLGLLIRRFRR